MSRALAISYVRSRSSQLNYRLFGRVLSKPWPHSNRRAKSFCYICHVLHDFEDTSCPVPAPSDVCVIGAGAVGIVLARQLAESGLTVTLLEGGGPRFETRSQDLYAVETSGRPFRGDRIGRYRAYGGSTTEWGGQILELDDFDFEKRDWIKGSGWPFDKSVLKSYYARALAMEGLRRAADSESDVWSTIGLQPPAFGSEFRVRFSNWCPERNFARLHGSYLDESPRVTVLLHANAVGLELESQGSRISGVHIRTFDGRSARVTARHYVVCLGGIESTRLLLQPCEHAPWQRSGLLGRFFQEHVACNGIPIDLTSINRPDAYFGYFHARGFRYHAKICLNLEQQRRHKTLNVAATINRMAKDDHRRDQVIRAVRRRREGGEKISPRTLASAFRYLPGEAMARGAARLRKEPPPWGAAMLSVHVEQLPTSASSITLTHRIDPLGMLGVRLDWKVADEERRTIREYVRIASEVFTREGTATIRPPRGFMEDDALLESMCGESFHHMGSTRMSVSENDGIVDPDLRLHGVGNGYVCSSSVFPTCGFSNPTHTLLALAIRLADKLSGVEGQRVEVRTPGREIEQIELSGSGRVTSQLGFGCAYLMGSGLDANASRRLLDAALDAGIRHFDTAPMYGQGWSEKLVGEALQSHPEVTVTTKYGLVPPSKTVRLTRAIGRRLPGVRRMMRDGPKKARYTVDDMTQNLEKSLRNLQRDRVELYLMHEPDVADLGSHELEAFLESVREAGKIGEFGLGIRSDQVESMRKGHPAYCHFLQFDQTPLDRGLEMNGTLQAHYRVFAPAKRLRAMIEKDPVKGRSWSEKLDIDLLEPGAIRMLLLRAALLQRPASLVLFSTTREDHIVDAAGAAADAKLEGPASKLLDLLARGEHIFIDD